MSQMNTGEEKPENKVRLILIRWAMFFKRKLLWVNNVASMKHLLLSSPTTEDHKAPIWLKIENMIVKDRIQDTNVDNSGELSVPLHQLSAQKATDGSCNRTLFSQTPKSLGVAAHTLVVCLN